MFYLVECDSAEFTKIPKLIHCNFFGENVSITEINQEWECKSIMNRKNKEKGVIE
jgi:hypothetical protein